MEKIILNSRILALLLMVIGVISSCFAYSFEVDGIYYQIYFEKKVGVTYGDSYSNNYSGNIVIPSTVEFNGEVYEVIDIHRAFYDCKELTSVTIPETVTYIGEEAFYGCSSLTSLALPESVEAIGPRAFIGCALTSLILPKNVTVCSNDAFGYGIKLAYPSHLPYPGVVSPWPIPPTRISYPTDCVIDDEGFIYDKEMTTIYYAPTDIDNSYTFPASLINIGEGAYSYCSSLVSANIPESVVSIGAGAFYGCSSLSSVTIPERVESIGEFTFSNCSSLGSVTIPESVVSIGTSAFSRCSSLASVAIPESVVSIGASAFSSCSSLASVIIPESVTTIGEGAFYGCSSLKAVTILSTMVNFDRESFDECPNLKEINISPSHESYSSMNGIVYNKEFTTLIAVPEGVKELKDLPNTLTVIGEYACAECYSLSSVILPESVIAIEKRAFSRCDSLESITLSEKLERIGEKAFYRCGSLPAIKLPKSLKYLDAYAFDSCEGLTSIEIPNLVQSIEQGTFVGCYSLSSVTIPASVISIGQEAFLHCYALKEIYNLNPNPQPIGYGCFEGVSGVTVYVPNGRYPYYKLEYDWKRFKIVELEDNPDEDPSQSEKVRLTVIDPIHGVVDYKQPYGYELQFSISPAAGWTVEAVRFNEKELTEDESGYYTTGKLEADSELQVIYSQITTGDEKILENLNDVRVYYQNGEIRIDNRPESELVTVYSESGIQMYCGFTDKIRCERTASIIIVQIAGKSYKLAIR